MEWGFSGDIDFEDEENQRKTFEDLPVNLQRDFEKSHEEMTDLNIPVDFSEEQVRDPRDIAKEFISPGSKMTIGEYMDQMAKSLRFLEEQDIQI